ncbi:disease resistance protein RPV1-like [Rosa rugosa]|uniref:disease resistance protein RPV1-like n=1 Tax=Rosa rugosa TaxID=74645 RepID=UPI002B412BD1|nr:disease resistance protein RPV1-like [Rosa rugosa]
MGKCTVYVVLCFFILCKTIIPRDCFIFWAKRLVFVKCMYVALSLLETIFKWTRGLALSADLCPWEYDVFLSFTGETRKGFTDHLYRALKRRGVNVFRDQQLERGTTLSSELLTVIEESRFAVIVLSQHYASSTWCLDELSKVFECMEVRGTILPIFYKVKPSNVRRLRGNFARAFYKHEYTNIAKVQRWRSAFTRVGGIAGWISDDWYESELIEKIVDCVCDAL